jgi:hypothetical protein
MLMFKYYPVLRRDDLGTRSSQQCCQAVRVEGCVQNPTSSHTFTEQFFDWHTALEIFHRIWTSVLSLPACLVHESRKMQSDFLGRKKGVASLPP